MLKLYTENEEKLINL